MPSWGSSQEPEELTGGRHDSPGPQASRLSAPPCTARCIRTVQGEAPPRCACLIHLYLSLCCRSKGFPPHCQNPRSLISQLPGPTSGWIVSSLHLVLQPKYHEFVLSTKHHLREKWTTGAVTLNSAGCMNSRICSYHFTDSV